MLPIKSALPLLLSGAVLSSGAFAAPSVYRLESPVMTQTRRLTST